MPDSHHSEQPDYLEALRDCACCPRQCHVDRAGGEHGYCHGGANFAVGSICVHRGEEPVFGGARGICNVFFSRCNLQCSYCQNWQISRHQGPVTERHLHLADVLREIEEVLDTGTRLVGFVSPSHCLPQMRAVISVLKDRLPRPVFVMNTNAYDSADAIRSLEGLIDVYLPDLKYMDPALADRLSGAADYPQVAGAALREMFRQKGSGLMLDAEGHVESGLIIRHLVLPGQVENSLKCLRFIAEELSPSVHLSLLAQYQPVPAVAGDPDLGRRLRPEEYEAVLDEMERLGFYRGWTQELTSAGNYNPDFESNEHPFEAKP